LAKCADWLVDGASAIATKLNAPPILIGILVVGIGTTAPELAVSVTAALEGKAEMALGNAIGSVIYDDGIALPLAALFAPTAIAIDRTVLRSAAIFLIVVDLLAYYLAYDGVLVRYEGALLVLCFIAYMVYNYWEQKTKTNQGSQEQDETDEALSVGKILLLFAGGLGGMIISSELIVKSATVIAYQMGVPEVIVALALVALGTSIPEVATCIIAARKGRGSLAVGNILGADILNICWIAGASAIVNPLAVGKDVINFIFPAMLVIVCSMLGLMRLNHQLNRWKGVVLLGLCLVYLVLLYTTNPGAIQAHS
jgi:cation:H+ antiporter